jgi:hypothetical protein
MLLMLVPTGAAQAFGSGFPGYGEILSRFNRRACESESALSLRHEILLLYFGLTADVNLDARKRASERVKQELEEQKQKGEVHIVRG